LDLIPFNWPFNWIDSIAALQAEINKTSTQLSSNAKSVEEIKEELENVKFDLVITYELEEKKISNHIRKTKLITYNYIPQYLGEYAVNKQIMGLLNHAMPSLKLNRGDAVDFLRLKSGLVIVKLNSVEIRDYILKNSSFFKKDRSIGGPRLHG